MVLEHVSRQLRKRPILVFAVGSLTVYSFFSQRSIQKEKSDEPIVQTTGSSQLKIKNLCFKGGGPKGIAYQGALEALDREENMNDLKDIIRVSGASAGAITATLLAVGFSPQEIGQLLDPAIMASFIDTGDAKWDEAVKSLTEDAVNSYFPKIMVPLKALLCYPWYHTQNVRALVSRRGCCKGDQFSNWLNDIIRDKVIKIVMSKAKDKNSRDEAKLREEYNNMTFGQLEVLIKEQNLEANSLSRFRHLYVATAKHSETAKGKLNLSVYSSEADSRLADDSDLIYAPNITIASAVRCSMAIPFFFAPGTLITKENAQLRTVSGKALGVDGGMLSNYPYHIFDRNIFLSQPDVSLPPSTHITNPETLGFYLYEEANMSFPEYFGATFLQVFLSFVGNIGAGTLLPEKIRYYQPRPKSCLENDVLERHVMIDNCGVSMLEFSMNKKTVDRLVQSGKRAVRTYRDDPSKKPTLVKAQEALFDKHADIKRKHLANFKSRAALNLSEFPHYEVRVEHERHIANLLNDYTSKEGKQVSIFGLPGSGKTVLSFHVANQYLNDLFMDSWRRQVLPTKLMLEEKDQSKEFAIWVLNAETSDTLNASYRWLATEIGMSQPSISNQLSANQLGERVRSKLSASRQRSLLIFDNVEEYGTIMKHIGQNHREHLMFTSKGPIIPRLSEEAYVNLNEGLSLSEAQGLLSRFQRKPTDDSLNLIEYVERLPLQLFLAGSYIDSERGVKDYYGYSNYLADLKANEKTIDSQLLQRFVSGTGYTSTQLGAILLAIQAIKSEDTLAVLRLCSTMPPERIPPEFITYYFGSLHHTFNVSQHKDELVKYGLIREAHLNESPIFLMHRTTQRLVVDSFDDAQLAELTDLHGMLLDREATIVQQYKSIGVPCIYFDEGLTGHFYTLVKEKPNLSISFVSSYAECCLFRGMTDYAYEIVKHAVQLVPNNYTLTENAKFRIYGLCLALAHSLQKPADDIQQELKELEKLVISFQPENNEDLGMSHLWLAYAYEAIMGDRASLSKAFQHYQGALTVLQRGADHSNANVTIIQSVKYAIAEWLYNHGKFGTSTDSIKNDNCSAIAYVRSALEDLPTVQAKILLARLLLSIGEVEEAHEEYSKIDMENAQGTLDTIRWCNFVGDANLLCFRGTGKRSRAILALKYFEAAIPYGESFRREVSYSCMRQGEVYEMLGDFKNACNSYQRACKLLEPDELHYRLSELYVHLADLNDRMGCFQDAWNFAAQACAVDEKMFGKEHISTQKSCGLLQYLSTLYPSLGEEKFKSSKANPCRLPACQ